jgi:hypothetical protein
MNDSGVSYESYKDLEHRAGRSQAEAGHVGTQGMLGSSGQTQSPGGLVSPQLSVFPREVRKPFFKVQILLSFKSWQFLK